MKIIFENLHIGWIGFRVLNNEKLIIQDSFSYTPYDSLGDLIDILDIMWKSVFEVHKIVILHNEPKEYELSFSKKDDVISLEIRHYEDNRRMSPPHEPLFYITGDYKKICLPFWRALRRLQSEHTAEELSRKWKRSFPVLELDELTRNLKKINY